MLNLEETTFILPTYDSQESFLLRLIQFSAPLLFFTEFLCSFIPETRLFQLDPGVYIFYLFLSLVYFIFTNFFFFSFPKKIEEEKKYGTKITTKSKILLSLKFSFILLVPFTLLIVNSIVPLSFDSFFTVSKETFDDRWSVDEVIFLGRSLTQLGIFLSQIPAIVSLLLNEEFGYRLLPFFWREITFFSFLIGGVFTPTVDATTQCLFAFSSLGLYLLLLNLIGKREKIKLGEGQFIV